VSCSPDQTLQAATSGRSPPALPGDHRLLDHSLRLRVITACDHHLRRQVLVQRHNSGKDGVNNGRRRDATEHQFLEYEQSAHEADGFLAVRKEERAGAFAGGVTQFGRFVDACRIGRKQMTLTVACIYSRCRRYYGDPEGIRRRRYGRSWLIARPHSSPISSGFRTGDAASPSQFGYGMSLGYGGSLAVARFAHLSFSTIYVLDVCY
jgi:hypothetical protein